ncbi:MAG: IS3 family transposase, partial [Clostridia bacterium]|nr:IS3 family transposase [Clostridia bacterium]
MEGVERRRSISGVRQEDYYKAIQYIHISEKYPIAKLCKFLSINRSAYYKWLKRTPSNRQLENEKIVKWIKELYEEQNGILGYRQMTITVNRKHNVHYNRKRIRRLMQILHLKSVCRKKRYNYIKSTPEVTAENILNRDFHADRPNEKWLTDVTEFKYYVGTEVKKIYLSAILDLYDKRIVAYKIGDSNNNALAFETFDEAVRTNPDAHPLFHSDRGFQYTSKIFYAKLVAANMQQSMSRVGRCIDNGPMEGFWGILKSEMYYLRKFTRPSQILCKPPMWCRIETTQWRKFLCQKEIVVPKNKQEEKKSENCCS